MSEAIIALLRAQQDDWFALVKKLSKHYRCHRCKDPTCCQIACQLTEQDVGMLMQATNKNPREFFREYCQVTKIGLYLKPPCAFLRKEKNESRCIVHNSRPYMCTVYPFSSYPGMLLNVDICPMSQDIAKDIKEIVDELGIPEDNEDPRGKATQQMLGVLDKLAPKSGMGDEEHMNIMTGVSVFRILLERKTI